MIELKTENNTVSIKDLIRIPKIGILAIAKDGDFYLLNAFGPKYPEDCQKVTFEVEGTKISRWMYGKDKFNWEVLGYQKHLNIAGEVIYFYRIKDLALGQDTLLAMLNDKILDYTFQKPDPERYGSSWTWGDNQWEWDVIKNYIAN